MEDRLDRDNPSYLEPWVLLWYAWVSASFLKSYLAAARPAGFLPGTDAQTRLLLETLMLDKALYELRYELNNRPGWVRIPIQGLLQLLETPE